MRRMGDTSKMYTYYQRKWVSDLQLSFEIQLICKLRAALVTFFIVFFLSKPALEITST